MGRFPIVIITMKIHRWYEKHRSSQMELLVSRRFEERRKWLRLSSEKGFLKKLQVFFLASIRLQHRHGYPLNENRLHRPPRASSSTSYQHMYEKPYWPIRLKTFMNHLKISNITRSVWNIDYDEAGTCLNSHIRCFKDLRQSRCRFDAFVFFRAELIRDDGSQLVVIASSSTQWRERRSNG